jgi:undecaprenyl-diphosphatase
MNLFQVLLLGFIQGVAEFLPISSSGHLVLTQQLLNINPPPYFFDIVLHLGTLGAVLIFFWSKIKQLNRNYLLHILIGTTPLLVVGFFASNQLTALFSSKLLVLGCLLITAGLNFATHRQLQTGSNKNLNKNSDSPLDWKKTVLIGIFQSLAIIPGISRSSTTLFAAILLGYRRQKAFEFSFLMSIPAILAANLYQLWQLEIPQTLIPTHLIIIGALTAFLTGLASLKLLQKLLKQAQFSWFGWYCLILALIGLTLS